MIDREKIPYISRSGLVRDKSWTRQIFSDVWESTNWENLIDNPLYTMIAKTKLTEKFIEDEKGTDLLLSRMWIEESLEVETLYLVCGYWSSRKYWKLSVRSIQIRTESLRESESERGEELKWRELQGMCLWNLGKNDESKALRHTDASDAYIKEIQYDEKIMRYIQVSKRGSGTTSEFNRINGRRQNDSSMRLRTHLYLPIHVLSRNILRVVRHKVCREPYLRRSQIVLMTTCKFLRWMHSTGRMDEGVVTEKCWSDIEEKMSKNSKKWIGWEVDMSQCSGEENLKTYSEDSDGEGKLENL